MTTPDFEPQYFDPQTFSGWRCFHCGDVFLEEAEARTHFGLNETATPACKIGPRDTGLLDALRRTEADLETWRLRALSAEDEAEAGEGVRGEIARYFKGARSAWEAFQLLDSTIGEVIALTEERDRYLHAIAWALGYDFGDDTFGEHEHQAGGQGAGRYWWRTELRRLADLTHERCNEVAGRAQ